VIIGELNDLFTAFDRIAEQFGCERIKTIGDAYLAVSGLPEPNPDHARAIANVAVRLVKYIERRNISHQHKWYCRVGLATGPVVGSVVGIQKYVYDVFGPAVNMAARLQAHAEPMTILIPDSMKGGLIEEFEIEDAGKRDLHGFGETRVLRLGGPARTMSTL
jgi:class 3 adenylate cyclase